MPPCLYYIYGVPVFGHCILYPHVTESIPFFLPPSTVLRFGFESVLDNSFRETRHGSRLTPAVTPAVHRLPLTRPCSAVGMSSGLSRTDSWRNFGAVENGQTGICFRSLGIILHTSSRIAGAPPPLQIDQHEGSLCALHRCGQASPNNVPEEENKKMCVLGMGCGRRASAS